MFQLMKKNDSYIIQLAILVPLLTLVWFIEIESLSTFQILMAGMWLTLGVLGGAINGEMIEEKMKGYAFLRALPIKDRDIVMSKFLQAGLTACVFVVHANILFAFLPGPAHLFALGRIIIPLFAGGALLLAALLYILVFRIGYSRFLKIAWTTFFVAVLSPVLVIEFVLLKIDMDYAQFISDIISLHWTVWLSVGLAFLAVYFGLMSLAVKAKEASKG